MRRLLPLFFLLIAPSLASAQSADTLLGQWWSEDRDGKIEIYECDDRFCGKLVWIERQDATDETLTDINNPDPERRTAPLVGLEILRDLRYRGDGVWNDGRIYDPESGNDYSVRIVLRDDGTLDLRGYVLTPLLGRSSTWTRAAEQ